MFSLRSTALTLIVLMGFAVDAIGQVSFSVGVPNIDSFPVIRIPVSVSDGKLPASGIGTGNFTVTEDANVAAAQVSLNGCSSDPNVAIAVVVDTSNSMRVSVGIGPQSNRAVAAFSACFSAFASNLPSSTALCLVPFADSSSYSYPGATKLFYSASNSADTTQFINRINQLRYNGTTTDVQAGIYFAGEVLALAPYQRRAIVLVTDDDIPQPDSVLQFLIANHLTLYIMEVSHDKGRNELNAWIAEQSGGAYYGAYDSTQYRPLMRAIASRIVGEHCTLRYMSSLMCPWWQTHQVQIGLSYKGQSLNANTSYELVSSFRDTTLPVITSITNDYVDRTLIATDPFPCQSGLKTTSLVVQNFFASSPRTTQDSAIYHARVIDSLVPGSLDLTAVDSAGNSSALRLLYYPQSDTLKPTALIDTLSTGHYRIRFYEKRPWDRGIASLTSIWVNAAKDSSAMSRDSASIYIRQIDASKALTASITATDSAGNTITFRLDVAARVGDTIAPVISQLALAEPRTAIEAVVTDSSNLDRGIKSITVSSANNLKLSALKYLGAKLARLSLSLTDSMSTASALITAIDSAGNMATKTLVYSPLPDNKPPAIAAIPGIDTSYTIYISDDSAWDRGIASVTVSSRINFDASEMQFTSGHIASFALRVSDKSRNANCVVTATDSAGNHSDLIVTYIAKNITIPLEDQVIDFGIIPAGSRDTIKAPISNLNPSISLNVSFPPPTGDDSVFSLLDKSSFPLGPNNIQLIRFAFHPTLVGSYRAVYAEFNGTSQIGSVTVIGQSAGTIGLALDTVRALNPYDGGSLHLSFDASPKPINLDTIAFTLDYDHDVITLGDFPLCPTGSLDTGLCLYNVSWLEALHTHVLMVRKTKAASATLSYGQTVLTLPFSTYVSASDSTVVHFSSVTSGKLTSFATHDGLVYVGDICGTKTMRKVIRGEPGVTIFRISPNPASSQLAVDLKSAQDQDAVLRLIDLRGSVLQTRYLHLAAGRQSISLNELPPSGTYDLSLTVDGAKRCDKLLQIVK